MIIKIIRKYFTEASTISELYVNDLFVCHTIEDKDRGLSSSMTLEEIQKIKIYGKTCIPYGKYELVINFSNRFQKYLPLLIGVPGYAGIRFHPGNKSEDTEGCILPGDYSTSKPDWVSNSRVNFSKLFDMMKKVEKKEKIFVIIEKYTSNPDKIT